MSKNCIQMCIFHGRRTPFEEMQDWGWQGPLIEGIASFFYSSGDLSMSFNSNEHHVKAAAMTAWQSEDKKLLVHDGFDPVTNPYKHEMVCCDEDNQGRSYYGDFELSAVNVDKMIIPMQLRLIKRSTEDIKHSIVIQNIDCVRFTYGNYSLNFRTNEDCESAQKITGWQEWAFCDSIDLPVKQETEEIIVKVSGENSGQIVLYDGFELTPMK